jgi:O-antigen/teichoic acid export membrane protein
VTSERLGRASDSTLVRDDIRKLFQHSSHYLGGLLCSMALGFVSFPVLTRLFSVSEYGLIDLVQRTVLLATALAKMGLQNAALRFYDAPAFSSDRKAAEEYYSTMCFGTALTAAAATLTFVIVVAILPNGVIATPFKLLLYLASPLIFLRGLESILWAFVRIQERTRAYNVSSVILRAGALAGIFMVLFWIERSIRGFFAGMLVAEALVVAVLLALLFKTGLLHVTRFHVTLLRSAFVFGFPLIVYELASIVLDSGDRLLVRYFLGSTALGYYSVAYNISGYIQDLILAPLNLALLPIYMNLWRNDGPERTIMFLNNGLGLFLMVAAGLFAIIAVTSRDVVIVLASLKYQPAASLIPVLVCGLLIYATHVFLCAGLIVHSRTLILAKSVFYAAVMNVVMNCVLLPRIGLQGAAIATLVSYTFCLCLMSSESSRLLPLKIGVSALSRYVAASAVTVLVVSQLAFGKPLLNLLGRGFLALVLYGGILCLTDSRPRELMATLWRKRLPRVREKIYSEIGAGAARD